ncbi:signal peptidase I [Candidatus Woesearchaeota archaeon]|nr:signal peptidase I [Candidatus Woesearchaeota archaeon]
MPRKRKQPTTWYGKTWRFIWYDDSLLSWIVNIVLAFLVIKFIVYPVLGAVLGTSLPVVAVVSESMDHDYTRDACSETYKLCGDLSSMRKHADFKEYWRQCGGWYEDRGITAQAFRDYPLSNGFSKGDIIILTGADPAGIRRGDVIVFQSRKPYPIIHRVIDKELTADGYLFATKGDHNALQITTAFDPLLDEAGVSEDAVMGVARFRVPWLGWVKVGLVELLQGNNC